MLYLQCFFTSFIMWRLAPHVNLNKTEFVWRGSGTVCSDCTVEMLLMHSCTRKWLLTSVQLSEGVALLYIYTHAATPFAFIVSDWKFVQTSSLSSCPSKCQFFICKIQMNQVEGGDIGWKFWWKKWFLKV